MENLFDSGISLDELVMTEEIKQAFIVAYLYVYNKGKCVERFPEGIKYLKKNKLLVQTSKGDILDKGLANNLTNFDVEVMCSVLFDGSIEKYNKNITRSVKLKEMANYFFTLDEKKQKVVLTDSGEYNLVLVMLRHTKRKASS